MTFNIFLVKMPIWKKKNFRFVNIHTTKILLLICDFTEKIVIFEKIYTSIIKYAYLYLEGFGVALALDDPVDEDTYVDGFS